MNIGELASVAINSLNNRVDKLESEKDALIKENEELKAQIQRLTNAKQKANTTPRQLEKAGEVKTYKSQWGC